MVSLRRKLAFSYGLLIAILFGVSMASIYHLVHLGRAVDTILVNNYQSILATENMKESLERQDSAAMFFTAGYADKARRQFADNAERFARELQIAAHNITEPGEDKIVADINQNYVAYRRALEGFLNPAEVVSPADRAHFYFDRLEPAFLALKNRLDDLLHINQQAMVAANDRAISQSWGAEVSTAISAAAALVIALLFAWRFIAYVVNPVSVLTGKAKQIAEGQFDQPIDISSKDEIGALAAEFNRMAARLREMRKSDYWQILIERKKSDAVIESLYEPVIVTDARGHVTKINRAAEQLFGPLRKGDKGAGDLSLHGLRAGDRILQAVENAVALQQPVAAEGEAALVPVRVGGAERSYRLRTTPIRDGDGRMLGAVTVLEDITALREVDRLKTEFISVASEKLRTPLRSLQMALHALINVNVGDLSEKQVELLYGARQDAEQLDELMSDLLELAEIESGTRRLVREPLRPVDLLRSAVENFRTSAECKHVKLTFRASSDLARVSADRRAVQRIFDNLLSNAIRHTGRDGEITLSAEEREDRVVFSVRDTGEGIPEAYLPNIFGRFVHVEGQPGGGTGLGLALVKRLVEAQEGQVGVQSRVGEGTTFTFTLLVADFTGQQAKEKSA